MPDRSDFEQYVQQIHDALGDDTIEFGVFNLATEQIGALRRVIWIPTTFKCDNNRHATFGSTTDGSLFADELFVECHITGTDFADTCVLRALVLNATRQVLGTGSKPVDGKYIGEEADDDTVYWGGASKIIQRFAWHLSVPEADVYYRRVDAIQVVDSTQITAAEGVLTPPDQLVIEE